MPFSKLFHPPRISHIQALTCQCTTTRTSPSAQHALRSPFLTTAVRTATSLAQGRANGARDGPGKRLGAKKGAEQYVVPGNILFRQRGTKWFPGENAAMGRDHTIHATAEGYVKFYRDPRRHPLRRYIGVVFKRHMTLPTPPDAPRRRRLGMFAVRRGEEADGLAPYIGVDGQGSQRDVVVGAGLGIAERLTAGAGKRREKDVRSLEKLGVAPGTRRSRLPTMVKRVNDRTFLLRSDGSFREGNWELGRFADQAAEKVKPFKRGDRWAAWKKAVKRRAEVAEKRSLGRKKK